MGSRTLRAAGRRGGGGGGIGARGPWAPQPVQWPMADGIRWRAGRPGD
jgi:hypothetical protein